MQTDTHQETKLRTVLGQTISSSAHPPLFLMLAEVSKRLHLTIIDNTIKMLHSCSVTHIDSCCYVGSLLSWVALHRPLNSLEIPV